MSVKKEDGQLASQLCNAVHGGSNSSQMLSTLGVSMILQRYSLRLCKIEVWNELADLSANEELARAIACLSNNKAPGQPGILPEMVKYDGSFFLRPLSCLRCTRSEQKTLSLRLGMMQNLYQFLRKETIPAVTIREKMPCWTSLAK